MKKNTLHKILAPILLVLIANQVTTGLLADELAPGAFVVFHKGGGIILAGLIVVHLILNFNWVKATYFSK
ncbi:MAG: hypothetical protein Q7T18_07050 [Sedimentisphaerales bacterium]|nr:hypothetical protein [Sedimentisphaerales bacterium]